MNCTFLFLCLMAIQLCTKGSKVSNSSKIYHESLWPSDNMLIQAMEAYSGPMTTMNETDAYFTHCPEFQYELLRFCRHTRHSCANRCDTYMDRGESDPFKSDTCSCDFLCSYFGDCCWDKASRCEVGTTLSSLKQGNFTCEDGHVVITACSGTNTSASHDLRLPFVTDPATGLSFQNIHVYTKCQYYGSVVPWSKYIYYEDIPISKLKTFLSTGFLDSQFRGALKNYPVHNVSYRKCGSEILMRCRTHRSKGQCNEGRTLRVKNINTFCGWKYNWQWDSSTMTPSSSNIIFPDSSSPITTSDDFPASCFIKHVDGASHINFSSNHKKITLKYKDEFSIDIAASDVRIPGEDVNVWEECFQPDKIRWCNLHRNCQENDIKYKEVCLPVENMIIQFITRSWTSEMKLLLHQIEMSVLGIKSSAMRSFRLNDFTLKKNTEGRFVAKKTIHIIRYTWHGEFGVKPVTHTVLEYLRKQRKTTLEIDHIILCLEMSDKRRMSRGPFLCDRLSPLTNPDKIHSFNANRLPIPYPKMDSTNTGRKIYREISYITLILTHIVIVRSFLIY